MQIEGYFETLDEQSKIWLLQRLWSIAVLCHTGTADLGTIRFDAAVLVSAIRRLADVEDPPLPPYHEE